MGIEELDVFGRLTDLEELYLELGGKIDVLKPDEIQESAVRARDNVIVANWAYLQSFVAVVYHVPKATRKQDAREHKDRMIKKLKKRGLSKERLDSLIESMTFVCDRMEES